MPTTAVPSNTAAETNPIPKVMTRKVPSRAVLAFTYPLCCVQAPILLHWFFNYYFTAFELAELWPSVSPVYTIVWIVTTVLGICGWFAVAILGINKVVITVVKRTNPLEVESLT